MKLTITIDCDNAAFEDFPHLEVFKILSDVTARIRRDVLAAQGSERHVTAWLQPFPMKLYDTNGNHVGEAKVTQARRKHGEPKQ